MCRIFDEFQHPAIQAKIVQHFGGFFHQLTVCLPIGRKDSVQTVCRRSRKLTAFLYVLIKAYPWYHSHADPIWLEGSFNKCGGLEADYNDNCCKRCSSFYFSM